MFNNVPVKLVDEHKYLGIILDKQLSFASHINSKLSIARTLEFRIDGVAEIIGVGGETPNHQ